MIMIIVIIIIIIIILIIIIIIQAVTKITTTAIIMIIITSQKCFSGQNTRFHLLQNLIIIFFSCILYLSCSGKVTTL